MNSGKQTTSENFLTEHLTAEKLGAYHAGNLAAENENVQNHLLACRECTANLLDLAEFTIDAAQNSNSPQPELDERFALLLGKIGFENQTAPPLIIEKSRRNWTLWFGGFGFAPTAIAAVLLVAALGLISFWLLQGETSPSNIAAQKETNNAAPIPAIDVNVAPPNLASNNSSQSNTKPAENAPRIIKPAPSPRIVSPPKKIAPPENIAAEREYVAQLFPAEGLRGDENTVQKITIPANRQKVVLQILPSVRLTERRYDLQLARDGNKVFRAANLHPNSAQIVTTKIERKLLPAGDYTLELRAAKSAETLQTFVFTIE